MKLANPKFRLNNLYSIVWHNGSVQIMRHNKAQQVILDAFLEYKRVIVLKGRQQGGSTLWAEIWYDMCQFIPNQNIVITAHKADTQKEIFKKCRFMHQDLFKRSGGKIIENGKEYNLSDSKYYTTTEMTLENWSSLKVSLDNTGQTVTFWEFSEASRNTNAEEVFSTGIAALNNWMCLIESTAYGTTGTGKWFADFWNDSVAGKTGFHPIFVAWLDEPRYEKEYYWEKFTQDIEAIRKFLWDYDTDTQNRKLTWYRDMKAIQKGKMQQEYPCYPEEAFLSSWTSVFDFAQINKLRKDPLYFDWDTKYPKEAKDVDEGLRIYNPPTEYNVTAIDPAGGNEKGDYTAIEVRDYERRLLAHYYGKAWPEKTQHIIRRLDELGYKGLIVPEINAQNGGRVYEKIMNDIEERVIDSEMYRRKRSPEDIKNWIPTKYAWDTNTRTRKDIIENYIDLFDRQVLDEIDDRVLNEMTHFYENDNWKKIATEGEHDDGILCSSICLWVVEQEDKYIVYATDKDVWL